MAKTKIDWCDWVYNPVWGCTGSCTYCYARKMAKRFGIVVNGKRYKDFEPRWIERNFNRPFPRKSCRIFVNSMSDLADWEPKWFNRVVGRILHHPEHLFLFLSKHPWSIDLEGFKAVKNMMLGYSATCQSDTDRLMDVGMGEVSFLSLEPLLSNINLNLYEEMKWVIVGAETGNRKDRVVPKLAWLVSIRDFARENRIPLFFKGSLRRIWIGELPQEYPPWPRR